MLLYKLNLLIIAWADPLIDAPSVIKVWFLDNSSAKTFTVVDEKFVVSAAINIAAIFFLFIIYLPG